MASARDSTAAPRRGAKERDRVRFLRPDEAPADRRSGPLARLRSTLFPGERAVWRIGSLFLLAGLAAVLVWLLVPREYYTGTNSVRTRSFVAEVGDKDYLCVPRLRVPAGTGQVEMDFSWFGPRPAVAGELHVAGGVVRSRAPGAPTPRLDVPHRGKVAFPIATTPAQPGHRLAQFCIRPEGDAVSVGGMAPLQGNDRPAIQDGSPVPARIAVWFRPPAGEKKALLAQLPDIARRAALFRPGWVGPWVYWLIPLLVLPGLALASLRLLATADRRRRALVLPLAVAGIALAHSVSWSVLTPPFQSPDEAEHFAYVQYLAETGKSIEAVGTGRSQYSSEQVFANEAVRYVSVSEAPDGRPPWLEADEREWRERSEAIGYSRDDGGGFTVAGSAHSPVYYAAAGVGYRVAEEGGPFAQLWGMRLVSALLGAIAAACAVLIVRELAPRRTLLQVAAGLLVAWQPMYAMVSGAVNNDNAVNACVALFLLVLVRTLVRGLSVPRAVALGALLVLAPLVKGTGYVTWPLALAALAVVAWRQHGRRDLLAWGSLAAVFFALTFLWAAISPTFERSTFTTPGGGTPVVQFGATTDPTGYLSYLWQVFLPPLPFMADLWTHGWPFYEIYVQRGWASFGWYAMEFPDWVYAAVIAGMLAVAALGARGLLVLHRPAALRRWAPIAALVALPIILVCAVHAAYFEPSKRLSIAEMGRYMFPAIAGLAALAAGAALGAGEKRWRAVAVGTTCVLVVFAYASTWLVLSSFYT